MTSFYIATVADEASMFHIYEIGTTADGAIANAVKAAGGETSDFAAHECTPELYAYVEAHGSPERWVINVDGKQDLEVEEIVE